MRRVVEPLDGIAVTGEGGGVMDYDTEDHLSRLSRLWRGYASKVYGGYSPVNAVLALAVSQDRRLLRRISQAPPHAHDPNMLLAVIQYLVRGGLDHPISQLYLQSHFDGEVGPLIDDLWSQNSDEVDRLMAVRRIQTNECGRAPMLALAISAAARQLRSDGVGLIDAGASAGLNLYLDDYRLSFGPAGSLGPEDSAVIIDCEIRGQRVQVPHRLPVIEERIGLDREPVDLSDERNRRWLLSCIWPGTGRHDRAAAAMEMVSKDPTLVRKADMIEGLPEAIHEMGRRPTVVVTSWSYGYLPPDGQARFQEALATAGRHQPVAWVSADTIGVVDLLQAPVEPVPGELVPGLLGLVVFRGDRIEARPLAYVQPHGAWIDWFPEA